jgi:hypothetical protein
LVLTACNGLYADNNSGAIAMVPFTDNDQGIEGVMPMEGWTDQAALLQQSFSGTGDELLALLKEQTDLISLPRSIGSYKGSRFTWDLYTFTTQFAEAEPGIYRVDMGVAEGDKFYLVTLITVPAAYEANTAFYETAFVHAMYALNPIE